MMAAFLKLSHLQPRHQRMLNNGYANTPAKIGFLEVKKMTAFSESCFATKPIYQNVRITYVAKKILLRLLQKSFLLQDIE